jgi:hypothetical protein
MDHTEKKAMYKHRLRLEWYIYKIRNATCGQPPEDKIEDRKGIDSPQKWSEGASPCWHCNFGLLSSRTVKQSISDILSQPDYGSLTQQYQETNTVTDSTLQSSLSGWKQYKFHSFPQSLIMLLQRKTKKIQDSVMGKLSSLTVKSGKM